MAIITKEVHGHKYLYEVFPWRENGKVRTKWFILGRLNDEGELIVKKNLRNVLKKVPAELKVKTVTTEYIVRPEKKKAKDAEKTEKLKKAKKIKDVKEKVKKGAKEKITPEKEKK